MDILFRKDSDKKTIQLSNETLKDLAVEEMIQRCTIVPDERLILKPIVSRIPFHEDDICFRQAIFRDFLDNPELREALYEALPMIRTMREYAGIKKAVSDKDNAIYTLLSDLRSLSTYVETCNYLYEHLSKYELKSEGLRNLREYLESIVTTEDFKQAGEDIKKMLDDLSSVRGALIGINFTPDLTISEIAAIEFLPYPLHSKYKFAEFASSIAMIVQGGSYHDYTSVKRDDPLMASMGPRLEKHLKRHFGSIKQLLAKYTKLDGHAITEMYEGLTFYLDFARFAGKLQSDGYEICMPEILKTQERTWESKEFYNIRLTFLGEKNIVKNDFAFSENERIFVLTGPNRGGKTILEQGLGILSLMASLGVFVTAKSCRGIPFCNILTHFPIDENLTINYGRLGEEAMRIHEIVKNADRDTLILFNETYSTTSSSDALYLSQDLLHILKEKGSAVIFNTHIHELAGTISEMNEWDGKSQIVSLVMEIKDNINTFKVKRSEPDYCSYARNIALKYGITYEQMKEEAAQES